MGKFNRIFRLPMPKYLEVDGESHELQTLLGVLNSQEGVEHVSYSDSVITVVCDEEVDVVGFYRGFSTSINLMIEALGVLKESHGVLVEC